ncbi:MAG: glycosyltransferase, partial [Pseudomonadota bacterium]
MPKSVMFLARSLERGGAERQLVLLATGLAARGHLVSVAVFYGGGIYEAELASAGVRIVDLRKQGRWDFLPFLCRLVRVLRIERPATLHGYLTVPNVLAS